VGGIGLGLSIVEDCVRAMGGFIVVESEERRGTTFTLRLPARAANG
jgi:signal transduction histidine kinase